jgi:hypothetical protein
MGAKQNAVALARTVEVTPQLVAAVESEVRKWLAACWSEDDYGFENLTRILVSHCFKDGGTAT